MPSSLKLPDGYTVIPKIMLYDQQELVCIKLKEYEVLCQYIRALVLMCQDTGMKQKVTFELKRLLDLIGGPICTYTEAGETMKNKEPQVDITTSAELHNEGYVTLDEFVQGGETNTLLDACLKRIAYDEIAQARKAKGWTQEELAQKVGLKQPQLCRIEKHPERASAATLSMLAKALEIEIIIPH